MDIASQEIGDNELKGHVLAGDTIVVYSLATGRIRRIIVSDTNGEIKDPAAGHVATSRSLDLTEMVTVDRLTAQQSRPWGLSKLQEFRSALRAAGRNSQTNPWVELPKLDRWDT